MRLILFSSFVVIVFISGLCGAFAAEPEKRYEKFADLDGKRIGVLTGTLFESLVNNILERTQVFSFDTQSEMLRALRGGELDCVVDDEPALRFIAAKDSRYRVLEESLAEFEYGFLFSEDKPEYVGAFNAELSALKESGELGKLVAKWQAGEGGPTADFERYSGDPLVRMMVFTEAPPFAYDDMQGNIIGIDVELAEIICRRLGYRLDVTRTGFDGMFDAILDGRADVIAASLSITEDRKEYGTFSIPYAGGGVCAMVMND